MLISLDKHSGVPIYRQFMDQVKYQILTGSIPEGDQLKSVREFASLLKINPMTIS